jgi:hypothetical protein
LGQIFRIRPSGPISDASHPHVFAAEKSLLAPRSIRARDGLVLVGQQNKRQPEPARELVVGGGGIGADAQHHEAALLEILELVAELAGLGGKQRVKSE